VERPLNAKTNDGAHKASRHNILHKKGISINIIFFIYLVESVDIARVFMQPE